MIPFERDVPVTDALTRAGNAIRQYGLRPTARTFGETVCTTEVALQTASGSVAAIGHGKGDALSAWVGALFEALEHYVGMHHRDAFRCTLVPAETVPSGLGTGIDELLAAQAEQMIGCRLYRDMGDGTPHYMPVALVQPRYIRRAHQGDAFDYHGLERYASNSGTAIGSTEAEAMLHALNESIERDDVSRWLHAHFHAETEEPLRKVDRTTCDAMLERTWRAAESALDDEIVLLDVGTHRGTTSRMAFAMHWPHAVHRYGAGSSLCPVHASGRALSELAQQAIRTKGTAIMDASATQSLARLDAWPRLARACRADLPQRMRNNAITTVDAGTRQAWVPPEAMVRQTVTALNDAGHRPLVHHLPTEGDVAACSIVVPGFSRYFLVGSGIPVAPF
jgi:ribosomal protein S12 methylthiotransferase accessory factor